LDILKIAADLTEIVGSNHVKLNEPMAVHTSIKIGGPADIIVSPDNEDTLSKAYIYCLENKVPVFVMGNGTNLIVRDNGLRGVVIKIHNNFNSYKIIDDKIIAQAGILLSRLSKIALQNELSGMEFAEGIPGTLGGAVTMNAGAYNGEMSFVVQSIKYLDKTGKIKSLGNKELEFGKRSSFVQKDGGIVLEAEMQLKKADKHQVSEQMNQFAKMRKEKQPLELPSAGSVFKRPEGNYAGKLIEDCGLKGLKIGGAQVSEKHCGFIVNIEKATACDVIDLIAHIQKTVKDNYGVELQTEVKIIGE
jgi:UDP-N-acetylmuramate dehydrogenase